MKKSIGAYQLGNRVFIHAKKGTESVPAFSEPLYELCIDDSPEIIGERIRECIEAYKPGRECYDREKWKTANDPLIKLAGEKDSKAFFTKVKNPSVVLLGDVLHFSPRDNHGWKEGFKKTEHPNIELDYTKATNEDLGNALLKAFELSSIK
jgi:hypothetical protein